MATGLKLKGCEYPIGLCNSFLTRFFINRDDVTHLDSKPLSFSLQRFARYINGGPHSFYYIPIEKLGNVVSPVVLLVKALYRLLFVPTKEKKIKPQLFIDAYVYQNLKEYFYSIAFWLTGGCLI